MGLREDVSRPESKRLDPVIRSSARIRTGPLPSVPWHSLRRMGTLEDHLPVLIVGGLVALAIIQFVLAT